MKLWTPLALAFAGMLASCTATVPFYGDHQSGISTPAPRFAFVAAFDLTTTDVADLRSLLKRWTAAAESLTAGRPVGRDTGLAVPALDTGEVLGYAPARLTVTFGVGPSLFDERFGLAPLRPAALAPLPAFAGDRLNPDWSDGDLVVQVASDDYQSAYHAIHTLTRTAQGVAVARWLQDGFQSGPDVKPEGPGRNLQGFIDGTRNPDPSQPEAMDKVVWVDEGPAWMHGGSYLVVRRIRMLVEVWDRSSLGDQQRTIGRDRATGQELPALSPDSHMLQARGGGVETLFRRPFHYTNGLDGRTGQWDSGLLFLAWMKDPRLQFVPMQTRLSNFDLLNEYIRPVGSAVFAVFPGVKPGDFVGSTLLPEAPLTQRIEGLQSRIGATYPALSRGDWVEVRAAAAGWNAAWGALRNVAGDRAAGIEALVGAWAEALSPEVPQTSTVRAAQAALTRELAAWKDAVSKPLAWNVGELTAPLALVRQAAALQRLDEARSAMAAFQTAWVAREGFVRGADASAYTEAELLLGTLGRALRSGDAAAAEKAAATLGERLDAVAPRAYGPWDAGFLLFREGLEALLVLAALLAFLAKTDQKRREPWVWTGAGLGLAASLGIALAVSALMTGWVVQAPELVEGWVGLAAVVMMLTVGVWLHAKGTVKTWNLWMKDRLGRTGGNPWALAALAFVAVLREGAETAVFLWGLAGSLSTADLLWGVAGALTVLTVLGVLMLGFSKRLPLQWFFPVATALIFFLAVKILGQSLGALQSAGWLEVTPWGWGAPVEVLGFRPTWETALPQLLLFVALAAWVALPWLQPKKPT